MTYRLPILTKLKTNVNFNTSIYGFDVETWQPNEKEKSGEVDFTRQNFLCGSIVGDNNYCKFFKDREEMADHMLNKKFIGCNFYATNLEFDFFHIFEMSKHFKDFIPIERNGFIYFKYINRGTNYIHFIDTMNYTGKVSVEKMGKLLNIPKLKTPMAFKKIPANDKEWAEMKAYNINDSLITYKFADFYTRNFCKVINAKPKITLASTGLDFWRRNCLDRDIFQEKEEIIRKHYEGSLHGGRTEVYIRGLVDQPFWCYDYNSHYPARCYYGIDGAGSYPLPSSSHYSEKISPSSIDVYEGITRCSLKAPDMHIPILGFSDNMQKYLFPSGKIEGWFTNLEIRKALDNGYQLIDTYDGVYYHELFKPFRKAVKFLYDLRRKYKDENNDIMAMMVKTLMNSALFGKFSQKLEYKSEMIHEDRLRIQNDGSLRFINEFNELIEYDKHFHRGDVFFCSKKGDMKIPVFIMPILSSYTTALGRLKLWDNMHKYDASVIYADTDSIFSLKPHWENSDDLGELKLEFKASKGIFVKPKFYEIPEHDKIKIKGLGRKPDTSMFNDILNGKHIKYEKFSRFRESRIRNVPFSAIIDQDKIFSLEDNKRLWQHKFSPYKMELSDPLVL